MSDLIEKLEKKAATLTRRIEGAAAAEVALAEVSRKLKRAKAGIPNLRIKTTEKRARYRDERNRHFKKARIFVFPDNEKGLEQLVYRHDRPVAIFRAYMPEMLAAFDLPPETKARWSQYAGCSCPCSPGFVLDVPGYGYDYFVTLAGIPETVAKPKNDRTEYRAGRAVQLIETGI